MNRDADVMYLLCFNNFQLFAKQHLEFLLKTVNNKRNVLDWKVVEREPRTDPKCKFKVELHVTENPQISYFSSRLVFINYFDTKAT